MSDLKEVSNTAKRTKEINEVIESLFELTALAEKTRSDAATLKYRLLGSGIDLDPHGEPISECVIGKLRQIRYDLSIYIQSISNDVNECNDAL